MRAEMIKRIMQIQETKIDLLWEEIEALTEIFRDNVNDLTPEIKQAFLKVTKSFIIKYSELVGEEDFYAEEKEED